MRLESIHLLGDFVFDPASDRTHHLAEVEPESRLARLQSKGIGLPAAAAAAARRLWPAGSTHTKHPGRDDERKASCKILEYLQVKRGRGRESEREIVTK